MKQPVLFMVTGVISFMASASPCGAAEPLAVDLILFAEHQTNIAAAPANEVPGFVFRAGLAMKGSGGGRFHTWNIDGNFGYQGYENDVIDERYDGSGIASASWLVIPGTLEWQVDYIESRQVVEIDNAPLGENITTLRQLGTGPLLTLNLSNVDRFSTYAKRRRIQRESHHYYSNDYGARLSRRLSSQHEIYLNGNYRETDFQIDVTDYNTYDAVAGYLYLTDTTRVTLEGGRGWIEEENREPVESDTGYASFSWLLSSDRRLSLSARQRFSDEAGELLDTDALVSAPSVQGVGAFQERRAALDYFGGIQPLSPSINAWAREKLYFFTNISQRDLYERGGAIRTRLYNADTAYVEISASQIRREFLDDERVDDDMQADIKLTHLLTRYITVTAGGGWFHRSSTYPPAEYKNIVVNVEVKVKLR